jgi:hypothetical protein
MVWEMLMLARNAMQQAKECVRPRGTRLVTHYVTVRPVEARARGSPSCC